MGFEKKDIGGDPLQDPLEAKHSYGMWEKYEPFLDVLPTVLPRAFEDRVLHPAARYMLVDPERDTICLRHILVWTCVNLPMACYILWYADVESWIFWPLVACYYFLWFTAMDTYVLQLHIMSHRKVFTPAFAPVMWHYYVSILGPIFGETPETYYVHHIGMHHKYNNYFDDLSCTLTYQRDSFVHWLTYFYKFLTIYPDLFRVFYGENNKLLARFLAGEGLWFGFLVYAASQRFVPAMLVLLMPVLVMRGGMMAGNWGQHAFINPDEPTTNFGHSVNIINSSYNRRCFNDGYHITHHMHPSAHYAELPALFLKELPTLAEHDVIVFSHPHWDFAAIWFHLMTKNYDELARRFVHIGSGPKRTHEEIKVLLKARTRPIYRRDQFSTETHALQKQAPSATKQD